MDHPHIRGEHGTVDLLTPSYLGSPPHTRGTPECLSVYSQLKGITPAYAGNTCSLNFCSSAFWDHPRIRGEHVQCLTIRPVERGSPPHTRGTLIDGAKGLASFGITPAYAGNTNYFYRTGCKCGDHPRIRGEHKSVSIANH